MADEGYSIMSPIDRETLRDVLACGSIEKVAKKQHKSISLIRMRLKSAIDTLDSLFRSWQDPHQMLMEMNLRVHKLENDIEERDRVILAQNERIEHQKNEIISLKSRLKGHSREASGYTQAPVPVTNLRCYGVTALRCYGLQKGPAFVMRAP